MKEKWKTIENYPNYEVSTLGNVRNKTTLKCLKPLNNGNGYLKIGIWIKGNTYKKQFYIHRLVAMTFIPNPQNKKEVNHIDGNKTNNVVSNLEWVTNSENKIHRYRILKQSTEAQRQNCKKLHRKGILHGKRIKCLENNKIYNSIMEASRDLQIPASAIYDTFRQRNRTNKNRKWFYNFIYI